jgi:hypothetical protein
VPTSTPYDALIYAAASLAGIDEIADIDELEISAVSALLQRNRAALESARRVLGPHCVVPVRYEESFWTDHVWHFSPLRNLARAFRVEARLATHNEDFLPTANIGLDILELANAVRRGGLVTDLLVGIAISGIAIEVLRKHRTKYDSPTRWQLIAQLQRLEAEREPFDTIAARDRDWEIAVGYYRKKSEVVSQELNDPEECGLPEEERREVLQLMQQVMDLPEQERQKMYLDQDRHQIALMRMLLIDVALREQSGSSGVFARHLSSLAPEMLAKVPVDPFTERRFIYRRVGATAFHLYSTGPKRSDGGGQIGPWPFVAAGCADLFLDAGDHWPASCPVAKKQTAVNRVSSAFGRWRRGWRR